MQSRETVCELVAALPGTGLDPPPVSNPAWRVNGKVLVRLDPRLRTPDEAELVRSRGRAVAVHVDRDERATLARDDPRTFFLTSHRESSPSVLVWLDSVAAGLLRELIAEAWRARAPKRLARAYRSSR